MLTNRSHPQHGVEFFQNSPTIVFDTVCVAPRGKFLNFPEVQKCLEEVWRAATHWKVGRYVIMPDHIHYFVAECNSPTTLDQWVRFWKSQFTKLYKPQNFRWQTDHWDYRIRKREQYDEKFTYMLQNPERAGLVKQSADWPFQGTIHDLRWD
jgi:REP element-mobilizing transposase RayT